MAKAARYPKAAPSRGSGQPTPPSLKREAPRPVPPGAKLLGGQSGKSVKGV